MNNIPHNISDELSLIQSDLMALLRRVNNLQQRIAEMTEKADNAIVEDETAQYIEPVVDTKQDCEPETYAPEASEISIPDKTNEPEEETDAFEEQTEYRQTTPRLQIALSINDRFRFRRELFANDDADMADTLDLISAMKSIGEVEDYLIDDLGWDRDNDEVRLFLSIIGRHFSSKPSHLL
ncbi:hypothetical protein [uncultured Duncaniella sp.]|jgi:hypothetical protein|uniref:hypothetical protein n=1 Tax=uncultured Duncaniella sp. TaxID=2768039 RepID=UPI0025A63506|nr:hypothetical protein [uncultured Duncaniella sp.]